MRLTFDSVFLEITFFIDVTVSMMRSSITQFENGGDVRVYATLDAPSGGIRKDVPITFTVTRLSTQGNY